MNLTGEQQRMADAIRDLIHGEEFPEAKLCAYTGKAASVLRAKSGLKVQTVHTLFYKLVDKGIDPKTKRRVLTFQRIRRRRGRNPQCRVRGTGRLAR
jgi:hypothetical protein